MVFLVLGSGLRHVMTYNLELILWELEVLMSVEDILILILSSHL